MAILRYEERVRVERANGLRDGEVTCIKECHKTPYDDSEYTGKSFADVASTPLRLNSVGLHPKVVVPVGETTIIADKPSVIQVTKPAQPYRLVDADLCDGRVIGVMETIASADSDTELKQSVSKVDVGSTVVDTIYDTPTEVGKVKTTLVDKTDELTQPLKTGETEVKTKTSKVNSKTTVTA